jgi:chromosome segregation ATPase
MNNKKVLSLILSVLIMMPTAVYAKENKNVQAKPEDKKIVEQKKEVNPKAASPEKAPDKSEVSKNGQEKKQEAQQKKDEKKDQIESFKSSMKEKHDQMKTLRDETIALRKEVAKKTEQLAAILADLQSGKKTISEEMLASLLASAQNLKADTEEIKETAELGTEAKDAQEKVKGSDFNNALASMDKVIAKYQKRLDALKALSADLDKAIQIANLAVAPAPADSTAPAAGVSNTTSSNESTKQ